MLGEKLGEGQHASVYKCYERTHPRHETDASTPLLANQMETDEYIFHPYAVKIVRDDDKEKIIAHLKEFEILNGLRHPNIVGAIEIFEDKFKNEVYQVLEFVEGQEILDEIAQARAYDEQDAARLYR